jgi:filamentous hemagglutinin family protein
MQCEWQRLVSIALSLAGSISLSCLARVASVEAQIVPDRTLGNESSRVTPNVTIKGLPSDRIDGGAVRGVNLFHSFQDFNIGSGRGAYFANPNGIANILTRVTGSNASNILGTLGVLGNANLFLINPNGIVFGPNARLDLRGSFLGSTASSVLFDNNFEFSATNPQTPPLLTINIPTGLRFRDNPGQILVQGRGQDLGLNGAVRGFDEEIGGLRVEPGRNLTLVGGNVQLDGGILQASEGKIELGGLLTAGRVGLNRDLSLTFPENVMRGNVSLVNRAGINVLGNNGGEISIKAGNIDISGNSLLTAGIASGLGSVNSQAGDIVLNGLGIIAIDSSRVEDKVSPNAIGNSGNIVIQASSLKNTNGARVNSSTFGLGNAGDISLQVSQGDVSLDGRDTIIASNVENNGVGNSGSIDIKANSLSLTNGAQLLTIVRGAKVPGDLAGKGIAGNITITVSNSATFETQSLLASSLGSRGQNGIELGTEGNGGNITILAGKEISLTGGSQLVANTFGLGNAGNISLQVFQGDVKLDGLESIIQSNVENNGIGNGGSIEIKANSLSLTNGAQLLTIVRGAKVPGDLAGKGIAGNITITVSNSAIFDNSLLASSLGSIGNDGIELGTEGKGGNITILAGKEISLTGGSQINANTFGIGNAGDIALQVSQGNVRLDGVNTAIQSNVENNGFGNGGSIDIKANSLLLTNGAKLQTLVRGAQTLDSIPGRGTAGNITITVSDRVSFDSGSQLSSRLGTVSNDIVEPGVEGKGGNITILAGKEISLVGSSRLSANTFGTGNAGTISLQVSQGNIKLDGAGTIIESDVDNGAIGDSGDISIKANSISLTNGAVISASTFGIGNAGNISLQALQGEIKLDGIGTTIFSSVENNSIGNGGSIDIVANTLSLTNGAQLQTLVRGQEAENSVAGKGIAGNITIAVSDRATFDTSSSILSSLGNINENNFILLGAEGRGGNITITAGNGIFFSNSSQINTSTFGLGNAGNVTINAGDIISFDGISQEGVISGILSDVDVNAIGNGGDVTVTAPLISLTASGLIVSNFGQGNAGNINTTAQALVLRDNSGIISNNLNRDGGNITVNTGALATIPRENNNITANAFLGRGGNVTINAQGIFGFQRRTRAEVESLIGTERLRTFDPFVDLPGTSNITAISLTDANLSGTVQFNTSGIDPSQGLVELPVNVVDPDRLIAQNPCVQGRGSQFIVTGKGGLPPSPSDAPNQNAVKVDLVEPATPANTEHEEKKITWIYCRVNHPFAMPTPKISKQLLLLKAGRLTTKGK